MSYTESVKRSGAGTSHRRHRVEGSGGPLKCNRSLGDLTPEFLTLSFFATQFPTRRSTRRQR